jgi:DNA polymerase elongation subunit (family B)
MPPLLTMRLRLDGDPINPNHGWRSELAVAVAGEEVVLSSERPEDLLRSLNRMLARYDPDVLLTEWGDGFLLPRLLRLSRRAGIPLVLNRDPGTAVALRRDRSYVTYGKTVYTAGARILHGRWHLDLRNSFIYTESEMAGLLEIARLARLPVQRLARTSTGTAISSMQLARAVQQHILVPWHKSEPEGFKTAADLLVTDKGGLTYQPLVGVYEGVGELDFSSMYPTIMARFNVSPETINCSCCHDAKVVPEIGHTVCQRRRGLVPQVLDHLLVRRAYYKRRKRETMGSERAIYDRRQTALKWCLVTCLAGETKVLYRYQGRWKIAPIGDIVDTYLPENQYGEVPVEDLFVTGVDRDLRTIVKQVRSVIKSPAPSTMIRMRLRWGREVVMTPNHRCYVLRGGRLKVKRADQLKVGDWIPLALTLDEVMSAGIGEIDLIRELKHRLSREEQKRWRVFGPAVQGFVRLLVTLGVDHRFVHQGHLHVLETKNLQETERLISNGRFLSAKHRRAFRYRQSVRKYGRLSQIPVRASGLLRLSEQARVLRVLRVSGIEMVSKALANLKLKQLENSKARGERHFADGLDRFRRLAHSSLIFARVTSVEQVAPASRSVYCFRLTREPTAFFIEGGVLTGNSFGYLGYKNARYGRIEAHEATTAYSREMLLRAKEVAESRGYRMLHAIVDSMWLQKPGAGHEAYEALAREIEAVTKLPLSVEGVYNWIAFLPSRTHAGVGVPNRYMGVFADGSTKVRGIEVRRSDVPGVVEEMQARMLREMFTAPSVPALRARLPAVLAVLEEALVRLREGSIRPAGLALTATISQEPHEYRSNHPIALAARLMARSGIRLHPGEAIQYVVTDADAKIREERVRPLTLLGTDWVYDQDYYADLLTRAAETVLELFGYPRKRLWKEVWERIREG